MRLSIVVPVYNTKKYLSRCIDSILAQDFTDFELILVDDGSNDGSGAICDEYAAADSRIRVLHQKNTGAQASVTNGVKISKGDYLTFADSDDWVEPKMYSTMMGLIDKYDLDCVICNYRTYYEETGKTKSADFGLKEGFYAGDNIDTFYSKLLGNFDDARFVTGSRWNKIFRREAVVEELLNASKEVKIAEDTCVTHKALLKNCKRVYFIDKDFYVYNRNAGSVTLSNYKPAYFHDWQKQIAVYRPFEDKLGGRKVLCQCEFIRLQKDVFEFILRSNVVVSQKIKWLKDVKSQADVKILVKECKGMRMRSLYTKGWYMVMSGRVGAFAYILYRKIRNIGGKILRKFRK